MNKDNILDYIIFFLIGILIGVIIMVLLIDTDINNNIEVEQKDKYYLQYEICVDEYYDIYEKPFGEIEIKINETVYNNWKNTKYINITIPKNQINNLQLLNRDYHEMNYQIRRNYNKRLEK